VAPWKLFLSFNFLMTSINFVKTFILLELCFGLKISDIAQFFNLSENISNVSIFEE